MLSGLVPHSIAFMHYLFESGAFTDPGVHSFGKHLKFSCLCLPSLGLQIHFYMTVGDLTSDYLYLLSHLYSLASSVFMFLEKGIYVLCKE